jgi:hypothetical protein
MKKSWPQVLLPFLTRILPRGKYRAARLLASLFPSLRYMPLRSPLLPGDVILGDMQETIFFPLLRYGRYPMKMVSMRCDKPCCDRVTAYGT